MLQYGTEVNINGSASLNNPKSNQYSLNQKITQRWVCLFVRWSLPALHRMIATWLNWSAIVISRYISRIGNNKAAEGIVKLSLADKDVVATPVLAQSC